MKKISRLTLNELSKDELEQRKMNNLKGGYCPSLCSCAYAGPQSDPNDSYYGGSSNVNNCDANSYANR